MESQAYIKNVPVSPKKMRFVANSVRGMKPAEAVQVLRYMNKKGAVILREAMLSAMANAKQTFRTSEDLLQCKALIVEEGLKMRRYRAGSKGMAKPYVRAFSHIKIVLTTKAQVKAVRPDAKKQETAPETKQLTSKEKEAAVATTKAAPKAKATTSRAAKPKQAEKPKPARVSRKGM